MRAMCECSAYVGSNIARAPSGAAVGEQQRLQHLVAIRWRRTAARPAGRGARRARRAASRGAAVRVPVAAAPSRSSASQRVDERGRRRVRALVGVEPDGDVELRRVVALERPQVVARRDRRVHELSAGTVSGLRAATERGVRGEALGRGDAPSTCGARAARPSALARTTCTCLRKCRRAARSANRAVRPVGQHVVHPGDVVAERGGRPRRRGTPRRRCARAGASASGSAVSSSRCSGAITFTASSAATASSTRTDPSAGCAGSHSISSRRAASASRRVERGARRRRPPRASHVDQHGRAAGAVLGLREQVGGGERRRERSRRRRPRPRTGPANDVDADAAGDLALGQRRRSGCRARRSRRPAAMVSVPYASAAIAWAPPIRYTSVDPGERGGGERGVGHPAVGRRRHAEHELVDPGELRGDGGHQHGRRVGGPTAGHVQTGPLDRDHDLAERHAVAVEHRLDDVGLERVVRARSGAAAISSAVRRSPGDARRARPAGRRRAHGGSARSAAVEPER